MNDSRAVSALKRSRSPTHSSQVLSWAEYDADILDNLHRTKRFAMEAVTSDLASKMTVTNSPAKSLERTIMSGADPMCMSSVENSPVITPKTRGATATRQEMHRPSSPGQRSSRSLLGRGPTPLHIAERMPTSPSDTQLDDIPDLRRATLMRIVLKRGGGGGGDEGGALDIPAPPPALSEVTPIASKRRSRLGDVGGVSNHLGNSVASMDASPSASAVGLPASACRYE